MELEKAIELLQDKTFDREQTFWDVLGGDVETEYTFIVSDPETLLEDIDIDLDKVTTMDDLLNKVEDGLYDILGVGNDGVEQP
mgnify:CR=1 FL=1